MENIPLKILKECDFSFHFLTNCINKATRNKKFPDSLKLSNIVLVHKKKVIQLYDYMENFFESTALWFP